MVIYKKIAPKEHRQLRKAILKKKLPKEQNHSFYYCNYKK